MRFALLAAVLELGCFGQRMALRPDLAALPIPAASPDLTEDHFKRDRTTGVNDEDLRAILAAPVYVDETQRVGVLPVSGQYRPDPSLPLPAVPAELTKSLEGNGMFQAASEISADWPTGYDVPGLRELAARYRAGYLLLYRHRFVDDNSTNAWCLLYPTIIGALVAPSRSLQTAGVLEATLFDVRSGTLLFTVYERVEAASQATPLNDDDRLREMKRRLLREAGEKLAVQVVGKVRHLIALRPGSSPAASARMVPSS